MMKLYACVFNMCKLIVDVMRSVFFASAAAAAVSGNAKTFSKSANGIFNVYALLLRLE